MVCNELTHNKMEQKRQDVYEEEGLRSVPQYAESGMNRQQAAAGTPRHHAGSGEVRRAEQG